MEQRIINVILRWMWLFVLATAIGSLGAYWFGLQQPTDYEASVRLIVGPGVDGLSPDLNDLRAGAQLMQTYSELATTRPVLQAVVDDVGLEESPDRLRRRITVRDNAETQILSIFVRDEDPVRSAAIANSIANVLLRLSPSGGESPAALLQNQIRTQVETIEENITTIEERIVQLEGDLQAATTAQEQQLYIDQLVQERARLAESRATLAVLLDSLLNTPTNQVKIVEPAIIGGAVSQSLALLGLTGGAAGLLLAAVSVLAYEYLDNSVKSVGELEEVAGMTVMGTVTLEDEAVYGQPDSLAVIGDQGSQTAEDYHRLATKLWLFASTNPLQTIIVTGLDEKVDANEVAANLAVVLARNGTQVLLIDANFARPTVHTQFEVPATRSGLADLLQSRTGSPQPFPVNDVAGLSVLPSGRVSYDAISKLTSPLTAELLEELKSKVDMVVIAAPPLSAAASLYLTSHADGVILIAQRGKSSYAKVEEAISNLNAVDVRLVGTVLAVRKWHVPLSVRNFFGSVLAGSKSAAGRVRGATNSAPDGFTEGDSQGLGQRVSTAVGRMRRGAGRGASAVASRVRSVSSSGGSGIDMNGTTAAEAGAEHAGSLSDSDQSEQRETEGNGMVASVDGRQPETVTASDEQYTDADRQEEAAEQDDVDESEETVVTS